MDKKVIFIIVLIVLVILVLIFVWPGRVMLAPTAQKEVNVTVAGIDPVNITIYNNSLVGILPNEGSPKNISFNLTVEDPNGLNDIDSNSVSANFTFGGFNEIREDTSCVDLNEDTSTSKNFSCTITAWYWDPYGIWDVTATAVDFGNGTFQQDIKTFDLGTRYGILISPTEALLFPTLIPGEANQNASNDPTLVNNTGNANTRLDISGVNLPASPGEPVQTAFIDVGNFSISESDDCLGSALQNNTDIAVVTPLPRGNNSAGQGQMNLYYCIPSLPSSIPAQKYSTPVGQPWIFTPA